METFIDWIQQDWFNAVQTIGIIGTTLVTLAAVRREARGRRIADFLTLTQHHRELWSEVHRRPDLARIVQAGVDLVAAPMTIAEEEFLMLVLNHFHVGWLLFREGGLLSLKVLAMDVRAFFALPLPRQIWNRTKHTRDRRFVRFIERALAKN